MKIVYWFVFLLWLLPCSLYSFETSFVSAKKDMFVKNAGQWNDTAQYAFDAKGGRVFFTKTGWRIVSASVADLQRAHELKSKKDSISFAYNYPIRSYCLEWQFRDSREGVGVKGETKLPNYNNYYLGNSTNNHHVEVPIYEQLNYEGLYKGVDVKLESDSGNLKYSFLVERDFNLDNLAYFIKGAESVTVRNGRLIIQTSLADNEEYIPIAYSIDEKGTKNAVACNYKINTDGSIGFTLEKPLPNGCRLLIDPVLVIGSYAWSTAMSYGFTATYDIAANLYLGAECFALGWAATNGAYQTTYAGGIDISIDKFNASGSQLLFSTYLGGASGENPRSMIVNSINQLYVLGVSGSTDFPIRQGAFQSTFKGWNDLTVTCFNALGTQLVASTFVGGSLNDGSNAISFIGDDFNRGEINLDKNEDVIVASSTNSTDFPITTGAFNSNYKGGNSDGVLFKINNSLSQMIWSTFIGGSDDDNVMSVAVDINNDVWITGGTESVNFFMPSTAIHNTHSGLSDGYIYKLSAQGSFLNGTYNNVIGKSDQGYFVQVDRHGNLYVMGLMDSTVTATPGHFSELNAKNYIQQWNVNTMNMNWVANFGAGSFSFSLLPTAFLVDNCDYIYICGHTGGITSVVTTPNAYLPLAPGGIDFLLWQFNPNATSVNYCTYFGGQMMDHVDGGTSRFDKRGVVYEAVCSGSSNMPTTTAATNSTNWTAYGFKFDFQNNSVIAQGATSFIDTFCAPMTINFTNFSYNGNGFVWDFGDGSPLDTNRTPSHLYSQAGTYHVILVASNSLSCNLSDTFKITLVCLTNTKPVANFTQTSDCSLATAFTNTTVGANYYHWDFGDNTTSVMNSPVHTYSQLGTYTVTLIAHNTVCGTSDTVSQIITFNQNSKSEIFSKDTTLCVGENLVLDSVRICCNGVLQTNFPASFVQMNQKVWKATMAGDYLLNAIVAFPSGCPQFDTIQFMVHVRDIPKVSFVSSKNNGIGGNLVQVTGSVVSASAYNLMWNLSNGVQVGNNLQWQLEIAPLYKVEICMIAVNDYLCADSVCQEVSFEPSLDFASAFSPNGDGKNDSWGVLVSAPELISKYDLRIFNRWGEQIFVSDQYSKRWDGKYKGIDQEIGEYIFVYEIEFIDASWNAASTGHLTLLR